jgi:hypothetical protein
VGVGIDANMVEENWRRKRRRTIVLIKSNKPYLAAGK